MVDRNQGLTTTYNQLKDSANHDPAIVALRRLHEDMDRAVLEAYGWSDIAVPPFETPTTPEQKLAFEAFSDVVVDRLFALNAERAAAEAHTSPTSSAPDRPRRGPNRAAPSSPRPTRGAAQSPARRRKAS